MVKELDEFLLPLKQVDDVTFNKWMNAQTRFNQWVELACATYEELYWVLLDSQRFDWGTAYSYRLMGCRQQAFGERAFFGSVLAAGDLSPFWTLVDGQGTEQPMRSENAWAEALQGALASTGTGAPEDDGIGQPDPLRWAKLVANLKDLGPSMERFVKLQCELLGQDQDLCRDRLTAWLYGMIDLTAEQ
jgi:hypothetical protein